jgi:Raf kinase inhibitor-like YbhB/YbcL family protein
MIAKFGILGIGAIAAAVALFTLWPASEAVTGEEAPDLAPVEPFRLTSPAFKQGEVIPRKHTGEGLDVSPPLKWLEPPDTTESFAVLVDDPDAPMGTWVHWILFNIPAIKRELPEAVPALDELPDGSLHGLNDFKKIGYNGPMPPPGKPHRYVFTLYALDTMLELPAKATRKDLDRAMRGHILAETHLVGIYQRR